MSTSSLSSLGLGSDSVLSYDVIDSLRAVDETAQLDPIDEDLATNSTQQTDLDTLTTLASALQTAASALADDIIIYSVQLQFQMMQYLLQLMEVQLFKILRYMLVH